MRPEPYAGLSLMGTRERSGGGAGKVTTKVAPPFGVGSTPIVAPWARTISATMAKPNPEPFRSSPARQKGSKTSATKPGSRPGP